MRNSGTERVAGSRDDVATSPRRAKADTSAAHGGYASEPNYYRLSYHLAVTRLNRALMLSAVAEDGDAAATKGVVGKLRRAVEQWGAREQHELAEIRLEEELTLARKDADELSRRTTEAREALRRHAAKRAPWLVTRNGFSPTQRRLLRFLDETVWPCSELLAAHATAMLGDPTTAERRATPIRELVRSNRVSYRVAYSLACYELAPLNHSSSDESTALALKALTIALRDAPNQRQRRALLCWSRKDPALARIHDWKDFDQLLKGFEIPLVAEGAARAGRKTS